MAVERQSVGIRDGWESMMLHEPIDIPLPFLLSSICHSFHPLSFVSVEGSFPLPLPILHRSIYTGLHIPLLSFISFQLLIALSM
jgi:hypothetical protein